MGIVDLKPDVLKVQPAIQNRPRPAEGFHLTIYYTKGVQCKIDFFDIFACEVIVISIRPYDVTEIS